MKYSFWFILGFLLLGSHLTYCQSPDYSNNIDEFVSQIEQLEQRKDQWVDSLIRIAVDNMQSEEVRRSAFMALGKVRSEKALKFLVDSYNTRIPFPEEAESLADQFPAVQSLYYSHLNDFDRIIKLVFQSLDTDEKPDLEIVLLAEIVSGALKKIPNTDREMIQNMVKKRRKALGYRQVSDAHRSNLERFLSCFY